MFNLINKRITIVLSFVFLISCGDDDDELKSEDIIPPTGNTLILSKSDVEWFLIIPPDSVLIEISGGKKPYLIAEFPTSSSVARIDDNILKLFPKNSGVGGSFGPDSVTVMDSEGYRRKVSILVKSQYSIFSKIKKADLSVSGDTALSRSMDQLFRADWDLFNQEVNIHVTDDSTIFRLIVKNVDSAGVYPIFHFGYDITLNHNKRITFVPKDSSQTVSFTALDSDSMVFHFDISAKDQWNNFSGNVQVMGDLKFGR